MANLLWSFAALGAYPGEQLLEAMALHMLQRIQTYRPQAISNSVWAFAKVGAAKPCYSPSLTCYTPTVGQPDDSPAYLNRAHHCLIQP